MSEKLNSKNRNIVAVALAGLALGAGVGSTEASAALGVPVPGLSKNSKVLAKGGNISQARTIIRPGFLDYSVKLKPKSPNDIEDLAIIDDPNSSHDIIGAAGASNNGEEAGFIVESVFGQTAIKAILFKVKTGVIEYVDASPSPIDRKEPIYDIATSKRTGRGYTASIDPQTNTHGPVVSFKHLAG